MKAALKNSPKKTKMRTCECNIGKVMVVGLSGKIWHAICFVLMGCWGEAVGCGYWPTALKF
ncbi:hypothetical protein EDD55_10580 [Varunaivibrio sulfuroxidans]|uniref:Uncharacterized protein n=1 Tax=Varunaivibrio sulfuroxidans TaxID=1773489 RepID=A0A4R3JAG2_9PROT|nr:hypothetical protein EDD55_10580 [Varunaivibrio sulfuroxidans]